jgi:hypothetical protein
VFETGERIGSKQEIQYVSIIAIVSAVGSVAYFLLPIKVDLKMDIFLHVLVLSLMKDLSAKPPIRAFRLTQKPEILKTTIDSYSVGLFTLFDHLKREM